MGGTTMFTNTLKSILTITLFVAVAFAQTFSVQGVLRDPVGRTVEDGAYSMTFKIYDQEVGGTALWTETHATIDIAHGVYVVELGTVTSMSGLTFGSQYYIGISVEGGQELEPRMKLSNSPTTMAVLGVDNVFPSSGNVGVGTADPQAGLDIITQNTDDDLLKITSSGGENRSVRVDNEGNLIINSGSVIQFASDGTSLASADFGGSATALSTPGDANITADALNEGTGNINFKIADATKATIDHDGNTGFTGDVTTTGEISAATLTAPSVSATNLSTGTITATGEISAATLTAPNIMYKVGEWSSTENDVHDFTITGLNSAVHKRYKVIWWIDYDYNTGQEDYLNIQFNGSSTNYASVTYQTFVEPQDEGYVGYEQGLTDCIILCRGGYTLEGLMYGEFIIDDTFDAYGWPTVTGTNGWASNSGTAVSTASHSGVWRSGASITSMKFRFINEKIDGYQVTIYALP